MDDDELREWLRNGTGVQPRAATERVEIDALTWAASQPPEIRAAVEAFLAQF